MESAAHQESQVLDASVEQHLLLLETCASGSPDQLTH